MQRFHLRWAVLLGVVAAFAAVPFAGQAASTKVATVKKPAAVSTTITVAAGKPSELAFKLSKFSKVPVGTVVFKVTNAGKIAHTFAICLKATTAAPNACVGAKKVTKLLQSGGTQTITVKLAKGTYEYICTFPGHAAAGMKGLIGVGTTMTAAQVKKAIKTALTATTTTATTTTTPGVTTTPPTTTTTTPPTTTTAGDGCPSGLTIITAGNTDNDQDENGQPSDGDGCI